MIVGSAAIPTSHARALVRLAEMPHRICRGRGRIPTPRASKGPRPAKIPDAVCRRKATITTSSARYTELSHKLLPNLLIRNHCFGVLGGRARRAAQASTIRKTFCKTGAFSFWRCIGSSAGGIRCSNTDLSHKNTDLSRKKCRPPTQANSDLSRKEYRLLAQANSDPLRKNTDLLCKEYRPLKQGSWRKCLQKDGIVAGDSFPLLCVYV
jgi:hypothetical protein